MKDEKLTFRELSYVNSSLILPLILAFGCVAQPAEQTSHKREVGGSNPPTATKLLGLVM